jgi:hypothetical protein
MRTSTRYIGGKISRQRLEFLLLCPKTDGKDRNVAIGEKYRPLPTKPLECLCTGSKKKIMKKTNSAFIWDCTFRSPNSN